MKTAGKLTVSNMIVNTLASAGIDHVFLVPGRLVYPLLRAIDESDKLRAIVGAHEAGTAFMADGYARASRRFGVCLGISGPGTMNFVPGMASARSDQIPVLYISGGISSSVEGKGAFQDATLGGISECSIVRSLFKNVAVIKNEKNLRAELRRLMNALDWTHRNQAFISIPVDIQQQRVEFVDGPNLWHDNQDFGQNELPADLIALKSLFIQYLAKDKKIAFLVGSRANDPETAEFLVKVAERFCIPVATTLSGKGAFPEDHPLSLGVYGFAGHTRAVTVINLEELDTLVIFGSDLNQRDSLNWSPELPNNKRLIIFDDSFDAPARGHIGIKSIFSGIKNSFKFLSDVKVDENEGILSSINNRREWATKIRDIPLCDPRYERMNLDSIVGVRPMYPGSVIKRLCELFPRDTNVVVDSGAHRIFMAHYWKSTGMANYFSSSSLAPMGWAIAAGIGVKVGAPDRPCVVVTGDGCMLMHGVEIQTAARYRVKTIFIVLNNAAHGALQIDAIRNGSISEHFGRLPSHDWATFATSLGVAARAVGCIEDLNEAVDVAMKFDGPFLIEVMVGVHPAPNRYYEEAESISQEAVLTLSDRGENNNQPFVEAPM